MHAVIAARRRPCACAGRSKPQRRGETITLLADDPLARIDVPHFARQAGHTLVDTTQVDGSWRFLVRKGG